jgi:glycosyltransferase involved in cell wall biosynthesis
MLQLAVLCDYPEEQWPSMDLCAEMLIRHLQTGHASQLHTSQIRPPFHWRWSRLPGLQTHRLTYNGDRLLNRFWDYPRYLRRYCQSFDRYHIADHTYAHLAHHLPSNRTGVFCHDIDAFRSLIEPAQEPRPAWFKTMSNHILQGLQKAAVVFYSTHSVRQQIEHYKLVNGDRLVHAPYGIPSEFTPSDSTFPISEIQNSKFNTQLSTPFPTPPFLLHVGSCIPRKRIDVLLNVFAAVRHTHPSMQLVKVGGEWTDAQRTQIEQLGVGRAVLHLQGLDREAIATLYRQATLVLLTSEAEGFGLPVVEALACGAIAVVSDIPVLREVGGNAAVYCPVANIPAWTTTINQLLHCPQQACDRHSRLAHAQTYSWAKHAQIVAETYQQL